MSSTDRGPKLIGVLDLTAAVAARSVRDQYHKRDPRTTFLLS
jgi:hypothetical protein